MINTLLTMSLTGSVMVLAWLFADKLAGKRLSAVWHDRILRLALFFMLVPVGALWKAALKEALVIFATGHTVQVPNVMQIAPVVTPDNTLTTAPPVISEVPSVVQPAAVTVSVDVFRLLTLVWAVGALAALCWKVWSYVRFRKLLRGERRPLSEEEMEVLAACRHELDVKSSIEAAVMPGLTTPMVTGLLRPVILLPDVTLCGEELRYLFLHELTHIKRWDLWVRFFALWGVVLHWYNPFMHLLDRMLKQSSEQSCDERVARPMSGRERLAYGGMLLKLACGPEFRNGTWAVTLSTREAIQKRLGSIVKAGHWTKADKIVALVTTVGLLCCGAVAACSMQEPLAVENQPKQPVQEEVIPGLEPDQQPNQEEQEKKLPEVARYGYAQAVMAVDWASFKTKITKPEAQALEKYLPVLEGGEFTWLAENGQTRTNIQGLLDSMFCANGSVSEMAYVEAVLFADMFQRGEENLCVLLPHLGYYWIIFHEENDVFYAIDMPVRWFGSVQKDGLYAGSDGAARQYYYRMSFENGNYTVADIAEVHDNVLFIGGEEKSAAEYEAWKKTNLKEEALWYLPSGMGYGREPESHDEEESETIETEHEQIGIHVAQPSEQMEQSGAFQEQEDKAADEIQADKEADTDESYATFSDSTGAQVTVKPNNHGVYSLPESVAELDSSNWPEELWKDLPDGAYPVNSRGETYGNREWRVYLQHEPDLIEDIGTQGESGYIWWEDPQRYYHSVEELDRVLWNDEGYLIPLYNSEHEQIGWKQEIGGYFNNEGDFVKLNKQMVDAIKADLS